MSEADGHDPACKSLNGFQNANDCLSDGVKSIDCDDHITSLASCLAGPEQIARALARDLMGILIKRKGAGFGKGHLLTSVVQVIIDILKSRLNDLPCFP